MSDNVNKNLDALCAKYGSLIVDYFPGCNQWRIWFPEFHQHHGVGCHGDLSARGDSVPQAIMRLSESVKREPPVRGRCAKGCPK